jgi:hypothetical protein
MLWFRRPVKGSRQPYAPNSAAPIRLPCSSTQRNGAQLDREEATVFQAEGELTGSGAGLAEGDEQRDGRTLERVVFIIAMLRTSSRHDRPTTSWRR